MITAIIAAVTAVLTGAMTYVAASRGNDAKREGIYAEHTQDLWDRLDKVTQDLEARTKERDGLRGQVEELQNKVEIQSKTIDQLNQTIGQLSAQMKDLNAGLRKGESFEN
jgi:peptidoglycan hydrolase CwlO-like protein